MEVSENLILKIHESVAGGVIHFAAPASSLRANELDLVRGMLQMMQGLSSSLFSWDEKEQFFRVKPGIYVNHLSQSSLYSVLDQFTYAATCLKLVDVLLKKVEKLKSPSSPTLRAFTSSVSTWLRRLLDIALREEVKVNSSDGSTMPTILGLSSSLSSLCSGAECLFEIVDGAIPQRYFELDPHVPAADIAVHILNYLYLMRNKVCIVQGGEEGAYRMLLSILTGSLSPYIENLDSWLFQGTLDDPFQEMFFVGNENISIEEAEFWERSYLPRSAMSEKLNSVDFATIGNKNSTKNCKVCPFFIEDAAKAIISTGKSLKLIRHAPLTSRAAVSSGNIEIRNSIGGLTLSEAFCISLTALIGHGDHISQSLWQDDKYQLLHAIEKSEEPEGLDGSLQNDTQAKKFWQKLLDDTLSQKRSNCSQDFSINFQQKGTEICPGNTEKLRQTYVPENPTITVCNDILRGNKDSWRSLNISQAFFLPPLDDELLRQAIFGDEGENRLMIKKTDYTYGFHFGEAERIRFHKDTKMLESLLPFPTLLPSFQDNLQISEYLPFQNNSTLQSKILNWIQDVEPKCTPPPSVILQQCLLFYIKKQADYVGRAMLSKLLHEWRLLDELGVLRAIYLLGSGDLLQHFLLVIFNKLDRGESLDDEFELNTILQESIRNSADSVLLATPDSLVVSVAKNPGSTEDEPTSPSISLSTPRKVRGQNYGMEILDSLTFTYKVSWPLELIANLEAIKKYNQVMNFLLKVKRAKFVLDKTRRWMWKDRHTSRTTRKRHWLLEQKLLHFVDAFHQYVMDRVYHNAWRELCEGISGAGTLDEAIEVHEAYLLSIQRQCFVIPDKLWGLIASRINSILGLALDFYYIQQSLVIGGATSTIKAKGAKEIERIEKQFDECMAFLLRILSVKLNVGQFPHLAALVTRINYNFYYMSEGGNLITGRGRGSSESRRA